MAAALLKAPVVEPVSRSVGKLNRVKSLPLEAEGSSYSLRQSVCMRA